jgi:biotin synthase
MCACERHDWTAAEIRALYEQPLFELVDQARRVHREYHPGNQVQLCALLSVKSGGCPEDCSYCAQSARHPTAVRPGPMMTIDGVLETARRAKAAGATRFCMGTAWRQVQEGGAFERVLEMVREVKALGLETCVTLGMLGREQALRLKQAGLDTYNHNLDTSPEYYPSVVTTHRYEDRLQTIRHVREAGISVCCGGIIGMGEGLEDRAVMLVELARLDPHPESVPINALVPVPGTPLAGNGQVEPLEFLRMIATTRIVLPRAKVRLSAGRASLSREMQLFCMYAGANSIFYGEALLTTPNVGPDLDAAMLRAAGLTALPPAV